MQKPKQTDYPGAIRCPHCGRWIVKTGEMVSKKTGYKVEFFNQVNWDKKSECWYESLNSHFVSTCRSRKYVH